MPRNPECPECGETFSDGRGLNGHLRMAHGIQGEEHERMMDQALKEAEEREAEIGLSEEMFFEGGVEKTSLTTLVKRVALHHGITPLKAVKNIERGMKSGDPWDGLEYESGGFLRKSEGKKAAEAILAELREELEKEKEAAGEAMNDALNREIQRRI